MLAPWANHIAEVKKTHVLRGISKLGLHCACETYLTSMNSTF